MKDKIFIVSDIHGCYDELIMLLNKHWNSDEEDLILLGDYVDRGSKSAEVLGFVYKHILNGGTALLGNHDQMLLDFLTFPLIREADYEDLSEMYAMWMYNGGDKTISSLLGLDEHLQDAFTTRKMLLEKTNVVEVISLLEPYYEHGDTLCVHAGIPVYRQPDWRTATKDEMIWTRPLALQKNKTDKTIIMGHTPTINLRKEGSHDVFLGDRSIFIDGACAYGGQLNAVVVDSKGNLLNTYKQESLSK